MAFGPGFLDELRRRLSIIDIVGRKVRLNRRGAQATGLCPFHNEKSPSFHVYDDGEPHYHCFGCGAHGDVITFVMTSEGLDFRNAVEKLAGEAGLEVPKDSPEERERAERQATLGSVMELACKYFEAQLGGLAGRAGADYFQRRGLSAEVIRKFRLGFAPDGRTALKSKLEKEQVPEALALEAGLLVKPEDGGASYDRFRGRVMFPIMDAKGRVIAFGGRTLGDDKPKYLNSPETPLFSKGRVLYNLNLAQKPARDKSEVVVAEGYMDVIALSEFGFPQAVAPLGTALTEDQIQLLWRLAPEPILCFDGDEAGRKAAARAAERGLPILRPGLSLRFAWLPAGEDPDSLARARGPEALRQVLDAAEPLVDMVWAQVLAGRPLDTPERRSGFRKDLVQAVGRIVDKSVQDAYREEIHNRFDALFGRRPAADGRGQGAIGQGKIGQWAAKGLKGRPGTPPFMLGGDAAKQGLGGMRRMGVETVMATVINHPELLHRHSEALAALHLAGGPLDNLRAAVIDLAARHPQLDSGQLQNHLRDLGFSAALDGLMARTGSSKFTLPSAGVAQAEEGLLHVMAVLREPEVDAELQAAARALAEDMSDENLARFEAARQLKLEVESRRNDLDRDDLGLIYKP